jgi:hypothetical protein
MERTAGDVVCAGFLQRNIALDDIDNVETVEQILNETFWNHSRPRSIENHCIPVSAGMTASLG